MTPRAPTATTAGLAPRLRLAVARTARRLRREAGGDVSPSQVAALSTVERHGPLTPSELASIEGVTRPTATRVLMRLAESGLVERTRDPADGRSALISLTPEGKERLRSIRRRKDIYLAERLDGLSAADRATLERATLILERMLEDDGAR